MLLICSATNQQKSHDIKTSCSTNPGIEGWNKQTVSKSLATSLISHDGTCITAHVEVYIYIYHTTYKNIYIICIVWDPQEQTIQVSNVKGCEVIKNAKLGHTVHPIMRYITSWRLFTIPRIIPRLPLPQQSSWSEQYYLQTTKIINIRIISDTVCSIAWFYPFIDMIQSTVWGQTQNHPVISHFVP